MCVLWTAGGCTAFGSQGLYVRWAFLCWKTGLNLCHWKIRPLVSELLKKSTRDVRDAPTGASLSLVSSSLRVGVVMPTLETASAEEDTSMYLYRKRMPLDLVLECALGELSMALASSTIPSRQCELAEKRSASTPKDFSIYSCSCLFLLSSSNNPWQRHTQK